MSVFLRHARTGYYYRAEREWVAVASEARDLGRLERAIAVADQEGREGMTIVIRQDDSGGEQVFEAGPGFLRELDLMAGMAGAATQRQWHG